MRNRHKKYYKIVVIKANYQCNQFFLLFVQCQQCKELNNSFKIEKIS